MAVEMVLLMPLMIAFMLLVVAGGRYVMVRGDVESASRDAARAASLERDPDDAVTSADQTAQASLDLNRAQCGPARLGGDFVAGGTVTVTLTCRVSYTGLGLLGLPGGVDITSTSAAPLDLYRRTA